MLPSIETEEILKVSDDEYAAIGEYKTDAANYQTQLFKADVTFKKHIPDSEIVGFESNKAKKAAKTPKRLPPNPSLEVYKSRHQNISIQ